MTKQISPREWEALSAYLDKQLSPRELSRLETRLDSERFHFHWAEQGGPVVEGEPDRRGFGASLARLSVENQLGGKLRQDWNRAGLEVFVDLPSTALSRRRHALKAADAATGTV